jgi:filamentous hemagglutinin
MTVKDVEVVIVATGEGSSYIRGDQNGDGKKDVFLLDVFDLVKDIEVSNIYGHESNHADDHRRGRDGGDEVTSTAAGDRLSEILGDKGKSNDFDLDKWLSSSDNYQSVMNDNYLDSEYDGSEKEGLYYNTMQNTDYIRQDKRKEMELKKTQNEGSKKSRRSG